MIEKEKGLNIGDLIVYKSIEAPRFAPTTAAGYIQKSDGRHVRVYWFNRLNYSYNYNASYILRYYDIYSVKKEKKTNEKENK